MEMFCLKLSSFYIFVFLFRFFRGSSHGDVVNVLDCDIVVSEFQIQSRFCVHFRTNALRKDMNSIIPPDMSEM